MLCFSHSKAPTLAMVHYYHKIWVSSGKRTAAKSVVIVPIAVIKNPHSTSRNIFARSRASASEGITADRHAAAGDEGGDSLSDAILSLTDFLEEADVVPKEAGADEDGGIACILEAGTPFEWCGRCVGFGDWGAR